MAAILFFLALVLALIHCFGGHLFDKHYLDVLAALVSGGLFCLAMGWGSLPLYFVQRRNPPA